MPHSELYLAVTQEGNGLFDTQKLYARLKEQDLNYGELSDLLRECNEAHFGIVSTYQLKDGKHLWIRDATKSEPLTNRMSHDSPTIEANNMLLRVLSRLRPIEHAIGKHLPDDQSIKEELKKQFNLLMGWVCVDAQNDNSVESKLDFIKSKGKYSARPVIDKLRFSRLF